MLNVGFQFLFDDYVVFDYHVDMLNTFGNSTQAILVDRASKSATENSQHSRYKRNAKVTASAVVDVCASRCCAKVVDLGAQTVSSLRCFRNAQSCSDANSPEMLEFVGRFSFLWVFEYPCSEVRNRFAC